MNLPNWFSEFKKAWDEFPLQDSEGYIPNRGDFKMGFSAGWHRLRAVYSKRLDEMKGEIDYLRAQLDAQSMRSRREALIPSSPEIGDMIPRSGAV